MDISKLAKEYGISQCYKKKSCIFSQGDENQYLYIITSGLLKAYYNSVDGKEYIKSFLFPGDSIASIRALQGGTCSFSLLCLQETQTIKIPYAKIISTAAEDINTAQAVINFLLLFSMKKEQREYELLCLNAEQRYNALLSQTPNITEFVTQNDIARYLGITPVALSRLKNNRPK